MGVQTVRYFDPVEETLEKLYRVNLIKKPNELPLDINHVFFLMPNGDYLWAGDDTHTDTMQKVAPDQPRLPNGSMRPVNHRQYLAFYTDLNIIKITYQPNPNNKLDYVILAPITPAQLRTIYRTDKDVPDLWITYDIVDLNKPFSVSGEGYREMLADLREKNYLPREIDSGQ